MSDKPTLKEPTDQGKKIDKNFKVKLKNINEVDDMLNEKEQSLKKKIFDLSKMEALVHSDEKLSAIYNEMAEEGEEAYGYHYNETIMNMIFNDHILNDPVYLQKYKNAIPKEKKRRDKSGIKQLQDAGEKEMDKKDAAKNECDEINTPPHSVTVDQSNDREELDRRIEKQYDTIDETTSAGGSAGAVGDSSRADGYSYVGPFGSKRDKELDKPAWNGGTVVQESYLTNPAKFKKMINENLNDNFNLEQDFTSPNNDTLVPMAEDHLHNRDDKINFIIQNTAVDDETLEPSDFEMLSDEEIDQTYNDVETFLGLNEKAESKSQQRFMGMVRAVQKGKLNSDDVSDKVLKAAEDMKPSDVKDFASTKHDDLPEKKKVNEETYQRLRKIQYYDKFGSLQDVEEVENGTVPEDKLSTLTDKPIIVTFDDDTTERVTFDEFNRMYGNNDEIDMEVKDVAPEPNMNSNPLGENSMIEPNPTSMKLGEPIGAVASFGGIGEAMGDQQYVEYYKEYTDETPFMRGNNKYNYVWAKYPDGKIDIGVYDFSKDLVYDYKWFRRYVLGIDESVNESTTIAEDGHCRKDEVPVPGRAENEEGSCKKKKTLGRKTNPDEQKRSPHNIAQRKEREAEYEKRKKQKNMEKKNDIESYEKQLKEFKEDLENTISEERRPSALVNLDRLKKQNNSNFKQFATANNTGEIANDETAMEQVTDVGKDPQKLAQDIEKEKLAQHKGESFENVGDSTNNNNKEIPKRNMTTEEQDEVDMMRMGMQDIVYDNKPSEKFEERMKDDMGDDLYKQRQEKMDYKAEAPMYNKDTEPVDDGEKVTQYDKYESKYNANKGIKEDFMFTGKYKLNNNTKFINFKLNEAVIIESVDDNLILLNLDGLGNKYTQKVDENISYNDIKKSTFYTDGTKVFRINNKKTLNENNSVSTKENVNESLNKMKGLINYKPHEHVDVNKTKRTRGF
jgi:hypothetical protein